MTPEGFHREMAVWLIGQGLALIGLLAGLVRWLLSREEDRLLAKMSEAWSGALKAHDSDERAHRVSQDAWELRRDKRLDAILLHVGDQIGSKLKDALAGSIASHSSDPYAHMVVSARLDERLRSLEGKLDHLITEHSLIAGRCRGDGGK